MHVALRIRRLTILAMFIFVLLPTIAHGQHLSLAWRDNMLYIDSPRIPGGKIEIFYLEAYCRADSQTADWTTHTVIPHTTELMSVTDDGRQLKLRCRVQDGVTVEHVITAREDEVDFQLTAHNPTDLRSEAHWAQPCIRVGKFTGTGRDSTRDAYAYIRKSFVFLDGKLSRMPTRNWATEARYTPGQVWAAPGVPRSDVNPRPLHEETPSHGLIGCFSADEQFLLAVAFEPYQELFQGVIRCLHSDFRLGGLKAGETKKIRGKLYLVRNNLSQLLERYRKDFPEHQP